MALTLPTDSQAVWNCALYLQMLSKGRIQTIRLHRLLYFCQGFTTAMDRPLLFSAPIEAWIEGPVVIPLWEKYQNPPWVDKHIEGSIDAIPLSDREYMKKVYTQYGTAKIEELDQWARNSGAWLEGRSNYCKSRNRLITEQMMRVHFTAALKKYKS